jgi:hypothetical protein
VLRGVRDQSRSNAAAVRLAERALLYVEEQPNLRAEAACRDPRDVVGAYDRVLGQPVCTRRDPCC